MLDPGAALPDALAAGKATLLEPLAARRLTAGEVVSHLIDRGILSSADVVAGEGLQVIEVSRRNHNFKVIDPFGRGVLVKQAVAYDRVFTVAHEAQLYRCLAELAREGAAVPRAPLFRGYDDATAVLVLDLVPGALTLGEHHARTGRSSAAIAYSLGGQVARLHELATTPAALQIMEEAAFSVAPWMLTVGCPDVEILQTSSAAMLQLIRLIQDDGEVGARLDELKASWRADALIHRDLRWDNCLVSHDTHRRRGNVVTLVDWEMCGAGDAAWDLGSLIGGYLRLWLGSIPVGGELALEETLSLARFRLDRLQPAMRALWGAYLAARQDPVPNVSDFLLRVTMYAGIDLLRSAFESAQASAMLSPHLAPVVQVGFNMLQRPAEAAVHLLGIELPGGRG